MSMTETIKLYDRDAYATEFEADIISCEPNKADDKQFDIILNQTLFFPEEGGQSPDMGILGGYRVVDVQIKNGVITHTVDISAGDCCEAEDVYKRQVRDCSGVKPTFDIPSQNSLHSLCARSFFSESA